MTSCAIGDPENDLILNTILDYMKAENVPSYDEKTGTGLLRHILIRSGVYSREVMICLVVNGDSLPSENKLVELLRVLPFVTSISINTNKSRGNVILGRKLRVLWGEESIVDTLHVYKVEYEESTRNPAASLHDDSAASGNDTSGIDASRTAHFIPTGEAVNFRISPLSFYQVNPKQTEKLYSIVLEYCKLNGHETAWDLYCGIGTISLFLAKHAKEVYGVESVEDAVRDARNNARLNNIENVEFETGRAEDVLPAYVDRHKSEHRKHPVDVIVVDPPRKGLDDVTIGVMLAMAPPRIVYVSCDPATMSRDLKKLTAAQKDAAGNKYSYKLQRVQPVDQFGHTVHVETVVLMSRVEGK
jgi:23S rRNA (uracil1939-C5)-methyltransferase